jgi:hypothetical protein
VIRQERPRRPTRDVSGSVRAVFRMAAQTRNTRTRRPVSRTQMQRRGCADQ